MIKGYVRNAQGADIATLATNLREADLAEIKAASGRTPEAALLTGLQGGTSKVACLPSGVPVAIFGIVPVAPSVGAVWMVATKEFHLLHRQFLRECRGELDELSADYRLIFNFTDARNTVHHRWIKWMGFSIIKRHETWGHEGLPFLEFCKLTERHHV
jgi:hypothetical protein